jgi:hypothetical protein
MDEEEERYGAFSIIKRGESLSSSEQREAARGNRPPYAVVEHDHLGPILRAGPFATLGQARRAAQALASAAADEAADDSQRRRHDHRNDGDDNDGNDKPSPRKASGWCH